MSYWLYMITESDQHSGLWRCCEPSVEGTLRRVLSKHEGVKGLNGLIGHRAKLAIDSGIAQMEQAPKRYEDAINLLKTVSYWCDLYPEGRIKVAA